LAKLRILRQIHTQTDPPSLEGRAAVVERWFSIQEVGFNLSGRLFYDFFVKANAGMVL